jgi:hypothetical protein
MTSFVSEGKHNIFMMSLMPYHVFGHRGDRKKVNDSGVVGA